MKGPTIALPERSEKKSNGMNASHLHHPLYSVVHAIRGRVRIRFATQPSPEQLRSLIWLLNEQSSDIKTRTTELGDGLVISSNDAQMSSNQLLVLLNTSLAHPVAHLNECPAPGLKGVWQRSKQNTISFLLVMAMMGWALPVIPGTPFFLLAWWLGWRPRKKDSA